MHLFVIRSFGLDKKITDICWSSRLSKKYFLLGGRARFGFLYFYPDFLILLDPFLHETIKIDPPESNKYCYWRVVEIRAGLEE